MEAYKKFVIEWSCLVMVMIIGFEPMLTNGQSFCNMSSAGLKACLPYVRTQNPVNDPPTPACCSALSNADPECFCGYKDSGLLSIYGVDPKLATQLPAKCNVGDPSFHC